MGTNLTMPATLRFGKAADCAIALPGTRLLCRVGYLLDEVRQQAGIALLPEQKAISRMPVAPGASRLLVILLDRFRQREMNHGAYGSLVDTQSESYGAHQHAHFVRHPALLVAPSSPGIHLAVICNGGNSLLLEEIHCPFDPGDRGGVDDDVAVRVLPKRPHQQAGLHAPIAFLHDIPQVGPMEAGDVLVRVAQPELIDNIVTHALGGACSKSCDVAVGKMEPEAAQLPVFRSKLVPPLRDAVRLVNGEKRDRDALEPTDCVCAREPLRRKIQQPVLALASLAHNHRLLVSRQRAVQQGSYNSHLGKLGDLVLHQSD